MRRRQAPKAGNAVKQSEGVVGYRVATELRRHRIG